MDKVIAIDFDGCLCENKWPEIGKANRYVFEEALAEQRNGAKLILWTNREGKLLEEAIEFCSFFGLHFDAVNESLPDWIEHFGSDPRKIGATEYWDDKAVRKEYKPMNKLATGGLVTGGINFGYQEPLTKAMEDAQRAITGAVSNQNAPEQPKEPENICHYGCDHDWSHTTTSRGVEVFCGKDSQNRRVGEKCPYSQDDIPQNVKRHRELCEGLNRLYAAKNADYGDSFHKSFEEWGLPMAAIRLGDKYNRFCRLIQNEANVKDESIRDTLIDLANYAIMTVMEIDRDAE